MKSHFYVYCIMSEKPTVRHATLAEAQSEAERLAAKEPGRSFEILRCVGIASTSQASTFWMDGEGPPEKPRYRMLDRGEFIQSGDEFSRDDGLTWQDTGLDGQQYVPFDQSEMGCIHHFPHRRPL